MHFMAVRSCNARVLSGVDRSGSGRWRCCHMDLYRWRKAVWDMDVVYRTFGKVVRKGILRKFNWWRT